MASRPVLGLIVNPIAGMGGRVGLRGTDGPDLLRRAVERGAEATAGDRFGQALRRLRTGGVALLAAPGPMGEEEAVELGLEVEVVGTLAAGTAAATGPEDTVAAATAMAERGVDLLLFAGGDGTARDVLEATRGAVPVLGVPTGVKMHSGVFAASPTRAGNAARAFLDDRSAAARLVDAEVVDAVESPSGDSREIRLYGRLPVPAGRLGILPAKSAAPRSGGPALDALCREIGAELGDGRLCILGPGTTTARIEAHMGVEGSLLGVDAVRDGALAGSDLSESDLLTLLDEHQGACLVVGVVGGQGSLFGRGNQQISPSVLKRVGSERIIVVCEEEKLLALSSPRLHVDTGDHGVDRMLSGHRRVRVAPGREVVIEVSG
jgi:predicted polyphosphate/ATP-dependent NAD kinase